MAAKYKSIQLKGRRDSNIAQWCVLVKEQWSGGISYLVKKAIRNYMEHGTFICIGKIHQCVEEERILSQQPYISLWIGDSPDIEQWIDMVGKNSIRPSTLMREIIRKSIIIIPDNEDEWIPSCLDFGSDIFDIANNTLPLNLRGKNNLSLKSEENINTLDSTNASVLSQKETPPTIQESGVKEIHTFKEKDKPIKKKPPRAAALSGRRFSQH